MNDFLRKHGVVADGKTLCTNALQKAIDVAAAESGILIIPPGTYRIGTIKLPGRFILDLMPGAILLGSDRIEDYEKGAHELAFNKDLQPYHLLVLDHLEDVTIRGGGCIDGNGTSFWEPIVSPNKWVKELSQRPSPMIQCSHCSNLNIHDITIKNSPGWTLHLESCSRVSIRGISIKNYLYGPNTDGIDIDGCRDVTISDCLIEAGDDAIVLKTTPKAQTCERVTVTNCIIETNCRALKLGAYESFHDMRQVCFSNCVVKNSVAAFGLYSRNGAMLEDIVVSNIVARSFSNGDYDQPIHIDLCRTHEDGERGGIRNVMVNNFLCHSNGRILVTAEPGSWAENITLSGIQFHPSQVFDPYPHGLTAKGVQFSPRSPEARAARAVLVADRVRNLRVHDLDVIWPETMPAPFHAIWGNQLMGGRIDCLGVEASDKTKDPIFLSSSTISSIR